LEDYEVPEDWWRNGYSPLEGENAADEATKYAKEHCELPTFPKNKYVAPTPKPIIIERPIVPIVEVMHRPIVIPTINVAPHPVIIQEHKEIIVTKPVFVKPEIRLAKQNITNTVHIQAPRPIPVAVQKPMVVQKPVAVQRPVISTKLNKTEGIKVGVAHNQVRGGVISQKFPSYTGKSQTRQATVTQPISRPTQTRAPRVASRPTTQHSNIGARLGGRVSTAPSTTRTATQTPTKFPKYTSSTRN